MLKAVTFLQRLIQGPMFGVEELGGGYHVGFGAGPGAGDKYIVTSGLPPAQLEYLRQQGIAMTAAAKEAEAKRKAQEDAEKASRRPVFSSEAEMRASWHAQEAREAAEEAQHRHSADGRRLRPDGGYIPLSHEEWVEAQRRGGF